MYEIEKFEFQTDIFKICKHFQNLGYEIIVITNQSGIGRGYYSLEEFETLTSWMVNEFEKNNIKISKVYFCPHSPDTNCECRKPKIGMIIQALNDFEIDLTNSWLIGDKQSDIQTAINANIPNRILISEKNEINSNSFITNKLLDTISIITK